jgi:CAAX prenyl protease-like protein
MTSTTPKPIDYDPRADKPGDPLDFWAYILPMGVFLAFTAMGGWWPQFYTLSYVIKTIAAAATMYWFWPHYTKIRWNYWWLGVVVGIIGILQWIPMQLWLQHHVAFFKIDEADAFNPFKHFEGRPGLMWSFIAIRLADAVLVVPVMEELFWRDWLWRTTLAPNDFKLARVGEWSPSALLIVSGMFSLVHGNWWLTAIVWGLMVGLLLVWTKSLGACIVAHGVTNLLLGLYVLRTNEWFFW